jgi:hypothetical protein
VNINSVPSFESRRTYYRLQILAILTKIIQNSLYTRRTRTFTPNCSKFWFCNTDFCNSLTIFLPFQILCGTYRKFHKRQEINTKISLILDHRLTLLNDLWNAHNPVQCCQSRAEMKCLCNVYSEMWDSLLLRINWFANKFERTVQEVFSIRPLFKVSVKSINNEIWTLFWYLAFDFQYPFFKARYFDPDSKLPV